MPDVVVVAANICDSLRDFVPLVQFLKREKHPRKVILLVKFQTPTCNFTRSSTPPWVFFTFFESLKLYRIAQSVSSIKICIF